MWNEKWQPLINEQKLVVLGVVQEQHAERTRLYQQWREFQWPIVQDALNLLQVKVVPLPIAINEQGVVVSHDARPEFIESWLADDPDTKAIDYSPQVDEKLAAIREKFLWQGAEGIGDSIADYESLIADSHKNNPQAHFEVAVCYRNRFDTTGNPDDFQKAIDHWSRALEFDPNQYIYRRRIQQYGARLGKPYPFYDWVPQAQTDIIERGDEPVELKVALSGAEIASPIRRFESMKSTIDWDSANRIDADESDLINAQAVAVPATVKPGSATRVHVLVSPGANAKWNNEGDPTAFVVESVDGAVLSQSSFEYDLPKEAESSETRRFEFEVLLDEQATDPVTIRGSVLINLCVVDSGVCIYLRKPVEITIQPALSQAP